MFYMLISFGNDNKMKSMYNKTKYRYRDIRKICFSSHISHVSIMPPEPGEQLARVIEQFYSTPIQYRHFVGLLLKKFSN